MVRLRDRNKQIPYGLKFTEQHTGWKSAPFSSFDTIVRGIIANRMGNPAQTAQRHLSTDYDQVAREVDYYNALVCQQMGWGDYVINDASVAPPLPPKSQAHNRLKAVVGGAKVLVDFVNKDEAVAQSLADSRAHKCTHLGGLDENGKPVPCQFNEKGDWLSWFTQPVADAIRKTMQLKKNMNLNTSMDPDLHVCSACSCPLKLKVWLPIERILEGMDDETKLELHQDCWILSESKK